MRRTLFALALVALAPAAVAQTTDVLYRSWRWMKEPAAGRAAGLSGAIVALGDDGAGVEANPAALATLSKVELIATLVQRGSGDSSVGDALARQTGVGFLSLSGPLSRRWAVGVYVTEPQAARIELAGPVLSDGTRDVGSLHGVVTDAGAAAAVRVGPRLCLGTRLTATRLRLDGDYGRLLPSEATGLRVVTSADTTRAGAAAGLLFEAGRRVRIALVHATGARFDVARSSTSPLLGVTLDEGSVHELHQPSVLSGGVSFRPDAKLLLAGQLDYVRYGELQIDAPAGGYTRYDYAIYAWEPRFAVELSLPLPSASLQVRAGVHGQSRGSLAAGEGVAGVPVLVTVPVPSPVPSPLPSPLVGPAPSPEPVPEPTPQQANAALLARLTALRDPPPGTLPESRWTASLGASLVTARGVRFDLAARFGRERPVFVVGTSLRF